MIDFSNFSLEHLSYAGIVVLLILTGAGLPIPEELIVIGAGVASGNGGLTPARAFCACLCGALLGDFVTYGIGHHFGRNVLREHHWFTRYVTPERERQLELMIEQHGLKVFFLARFMVGLRSPIYLTAGIMNVSFRRFAVVDSICASSVVGIFFGLSYVFADRMPVWIQWIRGGEVALTIAIVAAILGTVLFLYIRRRRRRLHKSFNPFDQTEKTQSRSVSNEPYQNGAASQGKVPGHTDSRGKAG